MFGHFVNEYSVQLQGSFGRQGSTTIVICRDTVKPFVVGGLTYVLLRVSFVSTGLFFTTIGAIIGLCPTISTGQRVGLTSLVDLERVKVRVVFSIGLVVRYSFTVYNGTYSCHGFGRFFVRGKGHTQRTKTGFTGVYI